jgi:DinB superfamily
MKQGAEELVNRLRSQMEAVEESFREIRASDRRRPITASEHPGGSPWNVNDHLAHVVQSEWGFLAIGQRLVANDPDPVRLSRRGNTPEERTAFVNRENQDQVQSRRGQSFEELLDELRNVSALRIQVVNGLSDEQLARPVAGSQRADLQWAALLGSTRHAEAHVELVRRAFAETRA